MPADTEWHMIGHLQSNKVKYIAPFVSMIHSVDTDKLLMTINKEGARNGRIIDVLLQFKIASEETKSGYEFDEFKRNHDAAFFNKLRNVRVCGVMGMATFIDDEEQVRSEFKKLKGIFDTLSTSLFTADHFSHISMGMSGDYTIAMEEGSTMVRIGSLIFGPRT